MRTLDPGFLIALGTLLLGAGANAQTTFLGSATLTWEISTDNGQSWAHGDIVIDQATRNVRMRPVLTWDGEAGYFVAVAFDGVYRPGPGVGLGDTITDVRPNAIDLINNPWVYRLPDLIKIDAFGDTEPPGQGSGWYHPGVTGTFGIGFPPLELLNCGVNLDGSIGTRHLEQVFPSYSQYPGRIIMTFRRVDQPGFVNFPTVHVVEPSLIVVPAPGGFVAGAVGVVLAWARRPGRTRPAPPARRRLG